MPNNFAVSRHNYNKQACTRTQCFNHPHQAICGDQSSVAQRKYHLAMHKLVPTDACSLPREDGAAPELVHGSAKRARTGHAQ